MPLNPFVWDNAIEEGVPRQPFTERTARQLKAGTHIALFGPRGTGKTSFTLDLRRELAREHEADAPPWELIRVDLRRVISLSAFIGAVSDAVEAHPSKGLRRRATAAFRTYEKEIGVNLGVVKAGIRAPGRRSGTDVGEILHGQLLALADVADRLVVVFDEFQRLNRCEGEPLSIIRSSLLAPTNQGRLSLLITGSLRERVEMMLHTSSEPIWDQTHDVELPALDPGAFIAYLEHNFEATGKQISERAAELLLELAEGHPKRTQHLAWQVWEEARAGAEIAPTDVQIAFDGLVTKASQGSNFFAVVDAMLDGAEGDVNSARALFLVAAGRSPGSPVATATYGLVSPTNARRALERLRSRGMVEGKGTAWRIVDPLFAAWLRNQDPIALLPPGGEPGQGRGGDG
jgi:DNA polymerase III delta prime subunit